MTIIYWKLLIGLLGATTIAVAAYFLRYLTKSGAVAVCFLGTTIFTCGNFSAYSLLFLLFGSSIVIQLIRKTFFPTIKDQVTEKTHARDAVQVLANGLIPCLLLIIHYLTALDLFLYAYVACLASACADTWASEIGILSSQTPRLILSHQKVEKGLSGGVTFLGTLASLGGSLLISGSFTLTHVLLTTDFQPMFFIFWLPFVIGWLSAFFDSILGETCQATYYDPNNQRYTEKPLTHDHPNQLIKGWRWCTNDCVNLLTSLFAALTTFLFYFLIS